MVTTLRAALSVLLLAGFYVAAGGLVAVFLWLTVLAARAGAGAGAAKLGLLAIVVVVALLRALWLVARAKPAPDPGVELGAAAAPELWATVRELAAAADTRVPDEIRLVPEVNAAVSEDARLLGLVGGRRRLYLGVPLVQALDVAQLRSVLAHELGHYSRSHTRLGPIAYRGRAVILATVQQLSGVAGWVLRGYARLYLLVSASVSRRQELEADELSVRVVGRDVAQGTLRELPVVDTAWAFYTGTYLADGWESGLAPTARGFFGGFGELLTARGSELAEIRTQAPPQEQSVWDSHPSVAARVAAMERMPSGDVPRDTRPATVLVPGFADAATAVAEAAVRFEDRTRLEWDELTARSVATGQQRTADSVHRAAARVAGVPRGTLGTVLDLVAAGRGAELTRELGLEDPGAGESDGDEVGAGDGADEVPPVQMALHVVVRAAAAQAGAARWQHSWSGSAELVGRDGAPFPVEDVVTAAAGPGGAPAARTLLAALGVDADAVGQVEERATAHGGEVLGGIANMQIAKAHHDVVILDRGLLLVPCPKRTEGGRDRIAALLASASVVELAAQHRFVPFEDVASAAVLKRVPVKVAFTLHDGTTLELKELWSGERLTKNSDELMLGAAQQFAPETVAAR
ncbi:M48 family metallopeptidase [Cellulomonas shaoxiangyii]|uniref:HtpX-like protease n=1 Tax=Cellulomonas shaoxiangyii TaxID=2566013 RepID=A0A4P7SEJ4_9CELL|nr:M48 family metallopeptidase [Cellulomonas shaoxiangyii]QCB92452.1 HtpX-like protease [Cellulomonas shaoxiangyii]TGY85655.1 HtpX-like protease [Cellulomonas shaoxiangyii]